MRFTRPTSQDLLLTSAATFFGIAVFAFLSLQLDLYSILNIHFKEFFYNQLVIALLTLNLPFMIYALIKVKAGDPIFAGARFKRYLSFAALIPSIFVFIFVIVIRAMN